MFSVRFITKCCVNVSNEKNSNNLCTKFINKIKVSKYSYKLINVSVLFSFGINRKSEWWWMMCKQVLTANKCLMMYSYCTSVSSGRMTHFFEASLLYSTTEDFKQSRCDWSAGSALICFIKCLEITAIFYTQIHIKKDCFNALMKSVTAWSLEPNVVFVLRWSTRSLLQLPLVAVLFVEPQCLISFAAFAEPQQRVFILCF